MNGRGVSPREGAGEKELEDYGGGARDCRVSQQTRRCGRHRPELLTSRASAHWRRDRGRTCLPPFRKRHTACDQSRGMADLMWRSHAPGVVPLACRLYERLDRHGTLSAEDMAELDRAAEELRDGLASGSATTDGGGGGPATTDGLVSGQATTMPCPWTDELVADGARLRAELDELSRQKAAVLVEARRGLAATEGRQGWLRLRFLTPGAFSTGPG